VVRFRSQIFESKRKNVCYSTRFNIIRPRHTCFRLGLTPEDEEGTMIALRYRHYRDRVRCIPPWISRSQFRKGRHGYGRRNPDAGIYAYRSSDQALCSLDTSLKVRALQLPQIVLYHLASPIGSLLLASAIGLSTLLLLWIHPSTHPHPNHLPQLLSGEIGAGRHLPPALSMLPGLARRRSSCHARAGRLYARGKRSLN
jgi:hypothetical protein